MIFEFIVNHLLGHIPTWVWPFVAGAGFATYVMAGIAGHIESVRMYGVIAKPVAIMVMILGVFFYGGSGVLEIQARALAEAQQQALLAQQASNNVNTQVRTVVVTKQKIIKINRDRMHEVIVHDQAAIDMDCNRINDVAWTDYNRGIVNRVKEQK